MVPTSLPSGGTFCALILHLLAVSPAPISRYVI
jgi:hypothetical protein